MAINDNYQRQISLLIREIQPLFNEYAPRKEKKHRWPRYILDIYDNANHLHAIGNIFLDNQKHFSTVKKLLIGSDMSGGVRVDEVLLRRVEIERKKLEKSA